MNPKHAQMEPQIRGVARKFHRRFGGDFADILQSAWVIFLECERTHDPARGILETRVEFMIFHRLWDQWISEKRRKRRERARQTPRAEFDASAILANLSDAAADIFNAILSTDYPPKIAKRRAARQIALAAGYGPATVRAAFAEIKSVL